MHEAPVNDATRFAAHPPHFPVFTPSSHPPLLLLHGALGTRAQLRGLADALDIGHSLHLPEFEGHGATPLGPGSTLRVEQLAAQVLRYLDNASLDTVRLFGYSLGGYVGLWLALHHPQRVQRLVVLASKLHWTVEAAAREAAMLDPAAIRSKVPAFADRLAELHPATGWEALVRASADLMTWMGEHAPLAEREFRSIAQPVRIIVGDRDATVSVAECAQVREWLPHAELEVYPRTAHPFERIPMARLATSVREGLLSHP